MVQETDPYDVLIIGQGAAAFSAGLYAARYQLRSAIFGDKFGGETAIGGLIENYPGYEGIDGFDLMVNMKKQVERYGVEIIDEGVTSISRSGECFEIITEEGDSYLGNSVVLAVGRERRQLGIPNEVEWTGKGISYCSVCDAPLYRGKVAAVVGGGNAAVEGAILLAKYASQVHIIYRGRSLTRPEPITVQRLPDISNLRVVFETNVVELRGSGGLDGIILDRPLDGSTELKVDGLFVEIGADPRTNLPLDLGVELNEQSEVKVDQMMRTSIDGVFAAGDLTDGSGSLKQTITAAAQGALAATSAYDFVSAHPSRCKAHAMGYMLN